MHAREEGVFRYCILAQTSLNRLSTMNGDCSNGLYDKLVCMVQLESQVQLEL